MNNPGRPTCYVIKENVKINRDGEPVVFDYSGLYEYGNVEFVTTFDPPHTPSVSMNEQWDKEVERFFEKFDPSVDWIVPTGSPYAIFKLAHRLARAFNPAGPLPRLLVWQNRTGRYYPVGV